MALALGADSQCRNTQGKTAFDLAKESGHQHLIDVFEGRSNRDILNAQAELPARFTDCDLVTEWFRTQKWCAHLAQAMQSNCGMADVKECVLHSAAEFAAEFCINGAVRLPKVLSPFAVSGILSEIAAMEVDPRDLFWRGVPGQKTHVGARSYASMPSMQWDFVQHMQGLFGEDKLAEDIELPSRIGWWVTALPSDELPNSCQEEAPDQGCALDWHIDGFDPKDPHVSLRTVQLLWLLVPTDHNNGATAFRAGSHHHIARMIRTLRGGDPVPAEVLREAFLEDPILPTLPMKFACGQPGDVWVLHPWLLHSITRNRTAVPRPQPHQFIWIRKGHPPFDMTNGNKALLARSHLMHPVSHKLVGSIWPCIEQTASTATYLLSAPEGSTTTTSTRQTLKYHFACQDPPIRVIDNDDLLLRSEQTPDLGWISLFHYYEQFTEKGVLIDARSAAILSKWIASVWCQLEVARVQAHRLWVCGENYQIRLLSHEELNRARTSMNVKSGD